MGRGRGRGAAQQQSPTMAGAIPGRGFEDSAVKAFAVRQQEPEAAASKATPTHYQPIEGKDTLSNLSANPEEEPDLMEINEEARVAAAHDSADSAADMIKAAFANKK
jgi:hypothetical protein